MRKFKLGLVALAATAAVAVPAGSAMAGTDSTSGASSATDLGCVALCEFSILDNNNIEVIKNIDVTTVANICPNISVVQITALAVGQVAVCDANNNSHKKVKKNW
ncbi:MAG: hypothetical protein QOJ85_2159 [Solirubrobacteraceae bacterium]|jgi:hypothetical protein|nr:hypothetical protein [Solirubrobacteraceae bacterium]MEA2296432.1 hypothetical protein [Solirubrobacteraceae bacterium]